MTHFCFNPYRFSGEIFDLEKVGQDHGVQLSQWCHSKANIKDFKSRISHFFAPTFTVSEILTLEMFDLEKESQGNGVLLPQRSHSMSNL